MAKHSKIKMMRNKQVGFTLAEVLITLGVIGIVAAITLQIIKKVQNNEIVSILKQDFSILSNATNSIQNDNGGNIIGGIGNSNDEYIILLQKYINFIKVCHTNSYTEGCFDYAGLNGANMKILTGAAWPWAASFTFPGAIFPNGSTMSVYNLSPTCANAGLDIKHCANIVIDTNGYKPPNTLGRDVFFMYLTEIGIVPRGTHNDRSVTSPNIYGCYNDSVTPGYGEGCPARVLKENAINY